MRYFGIDKQYMGSKSRVFKIFDADTGEIIYNLDINYNNKNYYTYFGILPEYECIKENLKDLCLMLELDSTHSYDRYILPLLRDYKLNILIK